MLSLDQAVERLASYQSTAKTYDDEFKRAAVCMILCERDGQPGLMMIKRAERASDPWSGHMAFPGGRVDPGDVSPYAAAVRESAEEIGFDPDKDGQLICQLPETRATLRRKHIDMVVTPFVFRVDVPIEATLNYEVAALKFIPLALFTDKANRESFIFERDAMQHELDCYYFGPDRYRIWGLSLHFIDEMLAILDR